MGYYVEPENILTEIVEDENEDILIIPYLYLTIDNQRHGLETQAKFLMLLTPHP